MNALCASLIVLPLAYFSWRFVEKPALKLRRYLGAGSKKLKAEIASRAQKNTRITRVFF
jgi:peptidoglycan/LPS O-acetylase OafA/YrhL